MAHCQKNFFFSSVRSHHFQFIFEWVEYEKINALVTYVSFLSITHNGHKSNPKRNEFRLTGLKNFRLSSSIYSLVGSHPFFHFYFQNNNWDTARIDSFVGTRAKLGKITSWLVNWLHVALIVDHTGFCSLISFLIYLILPFSGFSQIWAVCNAVLCLL